MKYRKHKFLSLGILCFVCFFVAAEPFRIANASLDQASTMACCVGKTEGHCDSGIALRKVPPPKSEPMCGLHGAEMEDDGITIVAEPITESPHSRIAETSSPQPAAEAASLSRPCQMDCGACATSATRQQKRERSIVQSKTYQATSLTTASKYEDKSLLFASSDNWSRLNPRGPPVHR